MSKTIEQVQLKRPNGTEIMPKNTIYDVFVDYGDEKNLNDKLIELESEVKTYADSVGNNIKNDLLNGAGPAYDSLKELGELINENTDAIDALETVAASKQPTITGAATTITSSNLTANRALVSNGSGKVAVSSVTSTELGYLSGATSKIQTQLNGKAPTNHASTGTTYGVGTESSYGHLKISDSISSSNGVAEGQAASSKAVKSAYDLASGANTVAAAAKTTADGSIKALSVSGKTITYTKNDGTTGTITTQDTNTTYSNMTGATSSAAGKAGLVPAPAAGKQVSFLRGDGTWVVPTNTTYSNFVKSGSGAKAGLVPAPSTTAGTTKYLREDGTWAVPPDNNTTYSTATTSAAGLMSAADKTKLNGIATGANAYTLPAATSSALGGVKVGSNITNSSGTISLTKANVTSALGYTPPTTNTTYSAATQSAAGLMSAADKTKLDGIATGANNYTYTLPAASTSLGGVKSGGDVTISSGVITVNDNSHNHNEIINGTAKAWVGNNNEMNFSSSNNNFYFGYTNTYNNSLPISTYFFGTHSGSAGSASGTINCGFLKAGGTLSIGTEDIANVGSHSGVIGTNCTCPASDSIVFGNNSTVDSDSGYSIAGGGGCRVKGMTSQALGYYTVAKGNQMAIGHYNTEMTGGSLEGSSSGQAFIIGNGTSRSSTGQAFRIRFDGLAFGKTYSSAGADYAEFFEWLDGNSLKEDRRGFFVTLEGTKIKKAQSNDYILGIVSATPSVIGNGDIEWQGRFLKDDFGSYIAEENEETEQNKAVVFKENPEYDSTKEYIQRADRPEWDAIGMLGALAVRDDGTCEVNGYCGVADGGIATKTETGYRVIERVNDHIVKIIFR